MLYFYVILNNPTGLVSSKSIKKIIENIDGSTKILIDESFIELIDEEDTIILVH